MTEIERMLTNTLMILEQELLQTQIKQEEMMVDHQETLTSHADILNIIQQKISFLSKNQQESAQHLHQLNTLFLNLEALLSLLNAKIQKI